MFMQAFNALRKGGMPFELHILQLPYYSGLSWGAEGLNSLLPPTILQPHRQVKHRLGASHMVLPIRHKVPNPLKLELLVGLGLGQ